jgi:hypothetical protein
MSADARQRLFENAACSIGGASEEVKARHIANCTGADPACGAGAGGVTLRGSCAVSALSSTYQRPPFGGTIGQSTD